MSRWQWLMVIVAGSLLWALLQDWDGDEVEEEPPADLADEPDLYSEDTIITQYREDGSLEYVLNSVKVRYFEDAERTHLTTPFLTIDRTPDPPWSASSETGFVKPADELDDDTETIVQLRDNVRLDQIDPEQRLTVTTTALDVYPERQYAETDRAVMIDTRVGRTESVGMKADIESGTLNLFSDDQTRVHTILLPAQFKKS
jgi:lipopolysaccharide export system protein LptC